MEMTRNKSFALGFYRYRVPANFHFRKYASTPRAEPESRDRYKSLCLRGYLREYISCREIEIILPIIHFIDLRATNMSNSPTNPPQIDLAAYLFTRLHQFGVRSIYGVPGDFNLVALDYIEPAGLNWVGNANELNACYATDGYARIKGISALITASGVGELSALNAVGGAFAERAPVVHIVGVPSTASQKARLIMHHSFGDGNFGGMRGFMRGLLVRR